MSNDLRTLEISGTPCYVCFLDLLTLLQKNMMRKQTLIQAPVECVAPLHTHTHTLTSTHTLGHWQSCPPTQKSPWASTPEPSLFDDVVFCVLLQTSWMKMKRAQTKKRKIESFHKVSGHSNTLAHTHTQSCTLAGHNVLSTFLSPFPVAVFAHHVPAPVDVVVTVAVAPHKRFSQCTQWRNKKNRNTSTALS